MDPHPVGDVDRLLGVVDADVHVHPEDQLLARDEPERRHQIAVARARHDPLVLPHRERMGSRRADRQVLARRRLADLGSERPQLLARLGGVPAGIGGDLEHGLHQLGLDLADRRRLEQAFDRVDELERIGVEDHQLLLDPDRVGIPVEFVVHRAPG